MYSFTLSLTSALDGDGCSMPRPGRFTRGKETRYPFIGGWMGPTVGLDYVYISIYENATSALS